METDAQRHKRFHADFEKLKHNREKVPLQQLQTRWERPYNTLVAEVMDGALWFYRRFMEDLDFPTHPKDEAGNKWLADRMAQIEADEKKPGGLLDQFQTVLIDDLDIEKYYDLVGKSYERRLQEAYDPYWQRHCRWVGEPPQRWIYSDIFRKYWWPKTEGYPDSGCWINSDYSGKDYRFPPHLKEETA